MTKAAPASPASVRPMVARPVSNRQVWIFGALVALAAIVLFTALEARRTAKVSPATAPSSSGGGLIASPPPLAVPGGYQGEYDPYAQGGVPLAPAIPVFRPAVMPGVPTSPRAAPIPTAPRVRTPQYYDPDSPDPVYRPGISPPAQVAAPATEPPPQPGQLAGPRVSASRFANPGHTVPQGTIIPAVLETALDSNRPGFVRAIVSRDVRSFDGVRILIPRGSRLFGEYKADLANGQNRAFVQWIRLIRPDGVQIAIDSPAADPLGRAGIKGKVNTHFFSRFGNALLQSTLDLGVGLATRSAAGGTVVLGMPGSQQTLINPQADAYKPTLTVPHGTSVSVFVARDLDFSEVER
jgi:type IV secretion system protein VirB10